MPDTPSLLQQAQAQLDDELAQPGSHVTVGVTGQAAQPTGVQVGLEVDRGGWSVGAAVRYAWDRTWTALGTLRW